jgi:hypothetical protein
MNLVAALVNDRHTGRFERLGELCC